MLQSSCQQRLPHVLAKMFSPGRCLVGVRQLGSCAAERLSSCAIAVSTRRSWQACQLKRPRCYVRSSITNRTDEPCCATVGRRCLRRCLPGAPGRPRHFDQPSAWADSSPWHHKRTGRRLGRQPQPQARLQLCGGAHGRPAAHPALSRLAERQVRRVRRRSVLPAPLPFLPPSTDPLPSDPLLPRPYALQAPDCAGVPPVARLCAHS